jgi:hypothetical protein
MVKFPAACDVVNRPYTSNAPPTEAVSFGVSFWAAQRKESMKRQIIDRLYQ